MSDDVDVLIVGSGPVGAAVAARVRELHPGATIAIVDAGEPVGTRTGEHLHNILDVDVRAEYTRRIRPTGQAGYVAASDTASCIAGNHSGVVSVGRLGHHAAEFPGAALAGDAGGMGIHWTVACPDPFGSEIPHFVPDEEWRTDLAIAKRLLSVQPEPYGWSPMARAVVTALDRAVGPSLPEGRAAGLLPMAGRLVAPGRFHRAGPLWVFPELADPTALTTVLLGTQVTALLHDGAHATGAVVRLRHTGETSTLAAKTVVVCADALRSPQLLFASGIRPAALGRYLNEHAFAMGGVDVEAGRIGARSADVPDRTDGDSFTNAYWVPFGGAAQPTMGQLMEVVTANEGRIQHRVGLTWYSPTEIDPENRVTFSDEEVDGAGMPRMTFRFSLSDRDRDMVTAALETQRRVGDALGDFAATGASQVLPPGSSLHYTGTVRMGPSDDGTSVSDPAGRVWGFDNLFVSGNGVIPTALACNSTLPAVALAMGTSRAVARMLAQ
jgi:choline dehydrogenase-like flavoprotein